jgi:dihydropteroate synthase
MGILNVTPDSFSDGGRYASVEVAVAHALQMVEDGAAMIDVGGESTRPGAAGVDEAEELERVVPVIRKLAAETDALISIDTSKAAVAEAALEAGAHIINDVTALTRDARMAEVARGSGAGVVLMHMRGTPRTMQEQPRYDEVVAEVRDYLAARCRALEGEGLEPGTLCVDPGIGFGKDLEHNLALLAALPEVGAGRPVLLGASRKSFLGVLTGREVGDRLAASLGVAVFAALNGAHIVRVHDVKETCDAVRVAGMLARQELNAHGHMGTNQTARTQ